MRPRSLHMILVTLAGSLISCSDAPAPPAMGTPAHYWSAAKASYSSGDYLKALDHLSKVAASDNEFRQQAAPWRLVLLAGLSKGNADLADEFDLGARANQAQTAPFRKQAYEARSEASRMAVDFAEALTAFQKKNGSNDVTIAFPYPAIGSPTPVSTGIGKGITPRPEEANSVRAQFVQRAVLLAACRALGNAEEETGKTREMLAKVPITVPRPIFFHAAAQWLLDQSAMFGKTKLNLVDREKLFKGRALEALEGLPDSKELKDLRTKIQASTKKS